MKNIKLKDLFLGNIDGIKESEEKGFENYFYTGNNYYNKLKKNEKKFIISGKKGTGKTILAKYFELQENKEGKISKLLTERDPILKILIEIKTIDINPEERDLLTEYIIILEIANIINENRRKLFLNFFTLFNLFKILKALKYINSIIKERYKTSSYILENITTEQYNKNEAELNINNNSMGGNLKKEVGNITKNNYIKNDYKNILNKLKKEVIYILKFININLLFDDLDEYRKIRTENEDLVDFLNSFIKISNSLNSEFLKSKNKKGRSRIIILLRSDIINFLNNNSSNLNKIIADAQIKLNWRENSDEKKTSPLIDMIITKIKNSSYELKNKSSKEILDNYFPKNVYSYPFEKFLKNYSFGKPRDIIFMLNCIKEEYGDSENFEETYFYKTSLSYAEHIIGEIRNEMHFFYENNKIEEYFYILEKMDKYKFTFLDVKTFFEKNKFSLNPEEFCEIGYQFGIIGNSWNKKKGKGRIFSWVYDENSTGKPNYNYDFEIHYSIAKKLLGNTPIFKK
ncbi:hypothetical protein CTM86_03020 [Fusobacterium pseudoperiodonticum]|uniref:FunZ protein n=1 Tax=Fusobacterium pseudoperiodonticum TaxID=2663009 RepID=A0AAD0F3G0_9FUSO|nr:hypothetical protein [Fusobacterium pseudoperiodonticum]ATV65635.1 hypothetical protein CTM86_03020 [Fusobacterium pseudoperiodonticum]